MKLSELAGKKIAVSGASGLVGSSLSEKASDWGCRITPLVRRREQDGPGAVYWNHETVELELATRRWD